MFTALRRFVAALLIVCLAPTAALAATEHVIEPGDEIEITIINSPESLGGSTVRIVVNPDGFASIPRVGPARVAGRTATQLADQLQATFKKMFAFAWVGVQIVKVKTPPQPGVIYLLGHIKQIGSMPLPDSGSITLMDMMGRAGGPTENADISHITIYRAAGGTEEVDYQKRLTDGTVREVTLQAGDTVQVHPNWIAQVGTVMPAIQMGMTAIGAVTVILNLINLFKPAPTAQTR